MVGHHIQDLYQIYSALQLQWLRDGSYETGIRHPVSLMPFRGRDLEGAARNLLLVRGSRNSLWAGPEGGEKGVGQIAEGAKGNVRAAMADLEMWLG